MKNHLLKLVFVLVCLVFMFAGCDKENNEEIQKEASSFATRTITIEEVPDIKTYFEQSNALFQIRNSEDEIIYDLKNVIETTSKEGLKNYIISFMHNSTDMYEFNNMIINVLPSGEKKSYTCKYLSNENSFEKFANNKFDFNYFDGVAEYTYLKKDANRDGDDPCPPLTFPFGSAANGIGSVPTDFNGTSITSTSNSNIFAANIGYGSYGFTLYFGSSSSTSSSSSTIGGGDNTQTTTGPVPHYHQVYYRINLNNQTNTVNPCPPPVPAGFVTPNISQTQINLLKNALGLTNPQWRWFTQVGNEDKFEPFYLAYASHPNRNTPETKAFFVAALNQMMQNPELNIDITASVNSPTFIDLSYVSGNTPEEVKFREIYNILKISSNFKNLFTNLFGVTNFINTKFKIENISQPGVAATCQLFQSSFGGLTNIIIVNRNALLTNSNVNIATAIIHECIHAFLNVKLRHPSLGMSVNNINNMSLQDCIITYYNSFSGSQSQHDFFVDFLIPTISTILNDLKEDLLTPQQISTAENPSYPNQCIYGVSSTIPVTSNGQVIPWSWTNYFYYQSQVGLQNCAAFNVINPLNSSNFFNFTQYVSLGTFLFAP